MRSIVLIYSFAETDELPLEGQLNLAIIGTIQEIWKKKQHRLRQQAEERQRYLRGQEIAMTNELKQKEAARHSDLESKAANWRKAASIREFVLATETAFDTGAMKFNTVGLEQWKARALAYADEIDPIAQGTPMTELADNQALE